MNKLLLFWYLLPLTILAQEVDYAKIPQLQTEATYTVEVMPNQITLNIPLAEGIYKGRISLEELENRLQTVLKANNIDIPKQLKVITLLSGYQSKFLKSDDIYKRKDYELNVNDAEVAGKILSDLEAQEIGYIHVVKTEYTELEELKIELKAKAVLKAQKQAQKMAEALNQTLGKAIFISDLRTHVHGNDGGSLNVKGSYNKTENKLLTINFDDIRVKVTVEVHFELK